MSESSSSQQQHPGAQAGPAAAAPQGVAYVGVPGVRFVPSDQELIINYLWPKLLGHELPTNLVQEADVYEEHPKDLTRRLGESVEGFWYVFSSRNRKYPKGKRPSRSTGTAGRWKAVGKNEEVHLNPDNKKKNLIGHKCGLAYELFVRDSSPSSSRQQTEKTEWKMCEFVAEDTNRPISSAPGKMLLNDWVLCRIARKAAAAGQVAVLEDQGRQAAPVDDEPHEDEQLQSAPPLDPSQLAQAHAMPSMPYLPHHGADGSYVTEEVGTARFDGDLEPPPRDGDVAATDVQFDDWSYRPEFWGDGGAGSEYGRAFDHEQWSVEHQFGPTSDHDPMLNQFEVLPTDPDPVLSPLDVLPADPQSWDIASTDLLFSDDGHELVVKVNDDAGEDGGTTTATNKTSAPADADGQK